MGYATVAVSNLDQTPTSGFNIGANGVAQGFRTGTLTRGYELHRIEARFAILQARYDNQLVATLHTATGGNPGAKVADLTKDARSGTGAQNRFFEAPEGTTLTANTLYFLVLKCAGATVAQSCGAWVRTNSDGEDPGALAGWSIENTGELGASGNTWNENAASFRLKVHLAAPEMSVWGNNTLIADGDTTPRAEDHTHFGDTDVANGATIRLFRIENNGREVLELSEGNKVTISGTHASDFSIDTQPASTVQPGGSLTYARVVVRFNPSARGSRTAELSIANNDADENPYNFTIRGNGTTRRIEVRGGSPAQAIAHGDTTPTHADHTDFGTTGAPGGSLTRTFIIRNTGGLDSTSLTGSPRVAVGGTHAGDFTVTRQPAASVGASGSSITFAVRFQPSAVGVRRATLSIAHNASVSGVTTGGNPYEFAVGGTGTAAAEIDVQGNGLGIADGDRTPRAEDHTDFGEVAVDGGTQSRTFTIRNRGFAALTMTGSAPVTVGGSGAANFRVTAQPAASVAGGGSTTFTVAYEPVLTGPVQAVVNIASNDSNENPYDFLVRGGATVSGALVSNHGRQGSGNVIVNSSRSDGQGFTTGSHPAGYILENVEIRAFQDANINTWTAQIREGSTVVATLVNPSDPGGGFQDTHVLAFAAPAGTHLKPGTAYAFHLSCTSSGCFRWRQANNGVDAGAAAGWSIPSGAPLTIRVNGRLAAAAPPPSTAGVTATPSALSVAEGGTGTFDVVLNTQPSADVTLNLTSFDRSIVTLDGTTPPTNIREVAFTAANWNMAQTVMVAGVDDGVDNPGSQRMTTIQMSASSTDNDYFISAGRDLVTVTVTDGAASGPEIDVQGNGRSIADGDGSPSAADHTDFGSVDVEDGTRARTFTIRNTGSGALTLSGSPRVAVGGTHAADFTVTAQPGSPVAAGTGTTTFTVRFDPAAAGARSATLSIANDDANENPYNFSIRGAGTDGGNGGNGGGDGGDGGGGGSGGGGSTAGVRILHAEPVVEGSPARFQITLDEPTRRRIDLLASTTPGTASGGADYERLSNHPVTVASGESGAWLEVPTLRDAEVEDDETFTVTLSVAPGSAPARVVRPQARGTILDGPPPGAEVPLFLAGGLESRHGFLRVLDLGGTGGTVSIAAFDDGGVEGTASTLPLEPRGGAHFNSSDLEMGNAAKGLAPGTGAPTRGDWRLRLTGADVGALAYVRTHDGFVTPLVGTVPADADGALFVAFFNPGSNYRQVSLLRLHNPNEEPAGIVVEGVDDAGAPGAAPVRLTLPGGRTRTLSARELEQGATGLDGALGDGKGKWRLNVTSDQPVEAMGLLESPSGHLANLSAGTAPRTAADDGTVRTLVPLFPAANDPDQRQGFLRVVNRGAKPAEVRILATDDTGEARPPLTLTVGAKEAVQLNSDDLELGAPAKGLPLGTGPGGGGWRLELTASADVVASAYVRHVFDGFVTGMNALAPVVDGEHRVDFLNPASNWRQASSLRLINASGATAQVTVRGIDDLGDSPGTPVSLTLPPGTARTLTSVDLESGAEDLEGALGDGKGKWRLRITSDQPIHVMSLLESPTGHLANLSPGIDADAP